MNLKLIIAAIALISSNLASAGIVNGNFESGDLTGWTRSGNVMVTAKVTPNFYFGAGSTGQNGNYAAAFNAGNQAPNGVLSQSFSTIIGTTYSVSYDFGVTQGGTQSLIAAVLGASNAVLATQTATDSNPSNPLGAFTFDFLANSITSTLRFSDVGTNQTNNLDGVLDNVTVVAKTPAAAVPEPASLALLGLGLAGMASLRRRRAA